MHEVHEVRKVTEKRKVDDGSWVYLVAWTWYLDIT